LYVFILIFFLVFTENNNYNNRPNGVRFIAPAGTTEFAKRWNPQPGDIVSFKHRGFMLASNKPKMPTLYRIRTDMTWDDVVQHWKEPAAPSPSKGGMYTPLRCTNSCLPRKISLSFIGYSIRALSRHKHGFWTDFENRKQFILNFAEKNGFDPMIEVNWKGKTGLLEDSQVRSGDQQTFVILNKVCTFLSFRDLV